MTTSGSPSQTSSVPSISPYWCKMRFFLASKSGSVDCFQVLMLEGHALLAEQEPEALVADVVDIPSGGKEVGELGQRPSREGKVMIDRTRPA